MGRLNPRWVRGATRKRGFAVSFLVCRGYEIARIERFRGRCYGYAFDVRIGLMRGDYRKAKRLVRRHAMDLPDGRNLLRLLELET